MRLLLLLLLSGCATLITLPSGLQGYATTCSADQTADCYKDATKRCGGGYRVISLDEGHQSEPATCASAGPLLPRRKGGDLSLFSNCRTRRSRRIS